MRKECRELKGVVKSEGGDLSTLYGDQFPDRDRKHTLDTWVLEARCLNVRLQLWP
jgi:hypothetical protein